MSHTHTREHTHAYTRTRNTRTTPLWNLVVVSSDSSYQPGVDWSVIMTLSPTWRVRNEGSPVGLV
jgi:hypothetical protein